jgi:hypothetical protein
VDPDIDPTITTEVWAAVYRPVDLTAGPYPLVVMLHGNHATCGKPSTTGGPRIDDNNSYATTGTCPSGYVVVPSHAGFRYAAERLASWGYIVVSVNSNRGINGLSGPVEDSGLNLRRGRLVLKHLQKLSEWNLYGGTPSSLGFDLRGKLDLQSVGLMGHSRGGEGMRAAVAQYRDPGSIWPAKIVPSIRFQSVFEIAPVDGQSTRILDAGGLRWNVLLPMCDADVYDLDGIKPYDRMLKNAGADSPLTAKSSLLVWGTNHNFYNTEWQVSDARGCHRHTPLFSTSQLGSEAQRNTGLIPLVSFFRASVGRTPNLTLDQMFDPLYDPPASLAGITALERGYNASPNQQLTTVVEDFAQTTGTNTYGPPNQASGITIQHAADFNWSHDPSQRVALISWPQGVARRNFQTNWSMLGTGRSLAGYQTLDIRVGLQCGDPPLCTIPVAGTQQSRPLDFGIQLVDRNGTATRTVRFRTYATTVGPVGAELYSSQAPVLIHPLLQTARIPISAFGTFSGSLYGVRFTFDSPSSFAITLGNITLSKAAGPTGEIPPQSGERVLIDRPWTAPQPVAEEPEAPIVRRTVVSGRTQTEVEFRSARPFTPRGKLLELRIGGRIYTEFRHPDGDLRRVVFAVDEFAQPGAEVLVTFGPAGEQWRFGRWLAR